LSSGVPRRCFKASPSRPRTSTSSTGGRRRTWHVSSRCCCRSTRRCGTTSPIAGCVRPRRCCPGGGQINISTTLGPIDPLCELDAGQGYDELLAHSELLVDEGRQLRVLDLPTLIRVKTKAGRPKDRVMLSVLIATLQEREKLGK
jgi:hypothetical protein